MTKTIFLREFEIYSQTCGSSGFQSCIIRSSTFSFKGDDSTFEGNMKEQAVGKWAGCRRVLKFAYPTSSFGGSHHYTHSKY